MNDRHHPSMTRTTANHRIGSRRPARADRPRHAVAERARSQEDLKVAQRLLMRLRRQMRTQLPVRAAVPEPHVEPELDIPTPGGVTIRIPPIARAMGTGAGVAGPTAFDQALDRLLDEVRGESDSNGDRPIYRAG